MLFGFVGTASSDAGGGGRGAAGQRRCSRLSPRPTTCAATGHPNVFHVRPSMADEAFKIVRQCATVGQTRIALIGDDDAMGRAGLAAVQQAMTELKLPPLVASALVPASGDKLDAALAAVQKQSPQAIVLVSLSGTTANVDPQAAQEPAMPAASWPSRSSASIRSTRRSARTSAAS